MPPTARQLIAHLLHRYPCPRAAGCQPIYTWACDITCPCHAPLLSLPVHAACSSKASSSAGGFSQESSAVASAVSSATASVCGGGDANAQAQAAAKATATATVRVDSGAMNWKNNKYSPGASTRGVGLQMKPRERATAPLACMLARLPPLPHFVYRIVRAIKSTPAGHRVCQRSRRGAVIPRLLRLRQRQRHRHRGCQGLCLCLCRGLCGGRRQVLPWPVASAELCPGHGCERADCHCHCLRCACSSGLLGPGPDTYSNAGQSCYGLGSRADSVPHCLPCPVLPGCCACFKPFQACQAALLSIPPRISQHRGRRPLLTYSPLFPYLPAAAADACASGGGSASASSSAISTAVATATAEAYATVRLLRHTQCKTSWRHLRCFVDSSVVRPLPCPLPPPRRPLPP